MRAPNKTKQKPLPAVRKLSMEDNKEKMISPLQIALSFHSKEALAHSPFVFPVGLTPSFPHFAKVVGPSTVTTINLDCSDTESCPWDSRHVSHYCPGFPPPLQQRCQQASANLPNCLSKGFFHHHLHRFDSSALPYLDQRK